MRRLVRVTRRLVEPVERHIDGAHAASAEVVDTIDVGTQPAGLDVTDTDLWVANSGDDTVSRIPLG